LIGEQRTEEEFGSRGVKNPDIIDLITSDSATGEVVLVIFEERSWGAAPGQLAEHDEKLNRYMVYILDGHLARQYPQYVGKAVRIQLDCAARPDEQTQRFLDNVEHICGMNGVRFVVNVVKTERVH
jgi:hypothetical protein